MKQLTKTALQFAFTPSEELPFLITPENLASHSAMKVCGVKGFEIKNDSYSDPLIFIGKETEKGIIGGPKNCLIIISNLQPLPEISTHTSGEAVIYYRRKNSDSDDSGFCHKFKILIRPDKEKGRVIEFYSSHKEIPLSYTMVQERRLN